MAPASSMTLTTARTQTLPAFHVRTDSWLRQLQLIAFDSTIIYVAIVVSSLFVAASYMWATTRAIDPSDKDAGAQVVNQKWNCFLVLTFLFKHINFK
jgi:hypothetical protein